MPGAFWDSWQLWEKMCFILGASIVVVIILGCFKLVFNHWRLRKYTAIAATKAAVRHEMRHTASVRRARGKEVPFGVRALESGIEVDGVWVSGTNTPRGSMSGSPTLTPKIEKPAQPGIQVPPSDGASSSSSMSRLEISQPAHGYRGGHPHVSASEASKARTGQGSHSIKQSTAPTERSTYMPPAIFAEPTSRGRDTYQPRRSSGLRFSNADTAYHSEALATLEGRLQVKAPNRQTSTDSDEEQESHRRSFSWAGSTNSEGYTHSKQSAQRESSSDDIHQGHRRAASPASSEDSNPFRTPTRAPNDGVAEEYQFDGVFEAAAHRVQMIQNDDITYDQGHAQPTRPFEADRKSQVIRKINSGFEILRPGTLDHPRQSNDTTALQEMPDNGNKRQSRKLQRKRRSSGASFSIGTRSIMGGPGR